MRPFLLAFLLCGAAAAQGTDPDAVRVHVLERRPFTEAGRWELSFFGATQVNPKFTQHSGLSAEVAYHLRENLAAQIGVWYFPVSVQSALSEELLTKARVAPESAEAFLLRGAALAGLELMPIYGKLNVFDGKILRLGVYLNGGVGAAKTRVQLLQQDSEAEWLPPRWFPLLELLRPPVRPAHRLRRRVALRLPQPL